MINFCIHGHFYQPPRENPWTGKIEKQDSAAPFHDWNERIFHECYKPNSHAQIIDGTGKVIEEVNNYVYINFNFGPTLLEWIKSKHPETYSEIIEADKRSIPLHNGHGNAIAMAYNHLIMPLANEKDKITQVKWGLRDFEYHFGRKSESIWLPETACNWDTIEVLINKDIKYIILDVSQAESVKKIGTDLWIDVSGGSIDPKMIYRCFSQIDAAKYVDIFFYDGPVSKSIAFDEVLNSSANLLNRINEAVPRNSAENPIISVATDGETFGHHKKFTERTLAHFLSKLAPENNFKIVNYGEYLELNPPTHEVKIKTGKNGEGTSWSCPHGVERWKDNCGCGGGKGWQQRWRKPLREAMDWLRDRLIEIYEQEGSKYLNDVWGARNDYINLILNNNEGTAFKFFEENAKRILTQDEINICYRLFEMQKYSMFMFTSCGWFFSEISGLETVQVMQYAAKAIDLAEAITGKSLEKEFRKKLFHAESNLKKYKNGRVVYNRLVIPARKDKS